MTPINFPNRPSQGLWDWYNERETYDTAIEDALQDHETRLDAGADSVGAVGAVFRGTQAEAEAAATEYGVPGFWFVEADPVTVTATAPTFTDASGTASDTYTIPAVTGVQYRVGGSPVSAGTYPGSGTVTVTAVALPGYTLTGTASWSHTFDTSSATAVAFDAAVTADAPAHFIKNADPVGTTAPLDTGSSPLTLTATGVTYGVSSPWSDTTAATFTPASLSSVLSAENTVGLTASFTLMAVFKTSVRNNGYLVNTEVNHTAASALTVPLARVGSISTTHSDAPTDVWLVQHAVFDGTNISLYRNGVLVNTAVASGSGNPGKLLLGVRGAGADQRLSGQMSRVAVWPTALSPSRILAHAEAGGFA